MYILERFNRLFPVWAVSLSAISYLKPELFLSFRPTIIYLLAVVMFGMGITLKPNDFIQLIKLKKVVMIGLALQFLIMPFTAWFIGHSLGLALPLLAGMILVGACPGGTASNVVCYLAGGNVALSIALTTASTLLAIIATPMLTWLYIGTSVDVPLFSMMLSILKVVVLPVGLGVLINYLLSSKYTSVVHVFPSISVIFICFIIAIIVASNQAKLQNLATLIIFAVVLHNLVGLLTAYVAGYLLGYSTKVCKTLAIEVGMQNSGLAVALASQYFQPIAALPGAIFSIWHNLSGAFFAAMWSRHSNNK